MREKKFFLKEKTYLKIPAEGESQKLVVVDQAMIDSLDIQYCTVAEMADARLVRPSAGLIQGVTVAALHFVEHIEVVHQMRSIPSCWMQEGHN